MNKFSFNVNGAGQDTYNKRYKSALSSLLLIALFSAINLVLLLVDSGRYFLFSAYIPYLLGDYAMFFSGRYPEEYYIEFPDIEFFGTEFFAILVAVAVVFILFYLLCWFMARKNRGVWLVFSLALFVIDTLVMFAVIGFSIEMLMDVVFHIWAIVSLSLGVAAHLKMKKFPVSDENVPENESASPDFFDGQERESSPVIRMADPDKKAKVFVEADFLTHHIAFQRTKRVNELVIDGKVYAEYEVLFEKAHSLEATVNGHKIEAVYDGTIMTYIYVDGKVIAKKVRLI